MTDEPTHGTSRFVVEVNMKCLDQESSYSGTVSKHHIEIEGSGYTEEQIGFLLQDQLDLLFSSLQYIKGVEQTDAPERVP